MKNLPVILAVCMLLFSSLDVHGANRNHGVGPTDSECCSQYRDSRLPKKAVVKVQHTSNNCSMDGVVLTMKTGAKFCVDPNKRWVKDIITHMKN